VNAQPNGQAYSIFPSDVEKYTFGGTLEVMEKEYADGNLFKADSIEALAEMMGIDAEALAATVAENNAQYKAGESDSFNSPVEQMILIENGPFYGEVHYSGMIGTITGLGIDENMHVIREDGSVIDNLYAIGELTYGDWFNGNYPMSGTGLGGCVSGGRIAAMDIIGK